jgi:pteridine reductase
VELRGKNVIVTGGAVRLGRAMALALADAGANVVLHYFSSQSAADETCAEIRDRGANAVAVRADLSRAEEAARQIVDAALDAFGPADVLVNSAAIFPAGRLLDVTGEQWRQTLAVNLEAPLFLCREFAARLSPGQAAHIVNIVDWRARRTDPGRLIYTLTKSGLVALTRNLALDLAPRVQVNAIAPGAILPPPGEGEDYLHRLAECIPLGRPGSPADVTAALLYLLRSDFVTGEVMHVTGGQQI